MSQAARRSRHATNVLCRKLAVSCNTQTHYLPLVHEPVVTTIAPIVPPLPKQPLREALAKVLGNQIFSKRSSNRTLRVGITS